MPLVAWKWQEGMATEKNENFLKGGEGGGECSWERIGLEGDWGKGGWVRDPKDFYLCSWGKQSAILGRKANMNSLPSQALQAYTDLDSIWRT